jgi:hypothetical protein
VAVAVGGEAEGPPVLLAAEAPPVPEAVRAATLGQSVEETPADPHEDAEDTMGASPAPAQDEPGSELESAGSV